MAFIVPFIPYILGAASVAVSVSAAQDAKKANKQAAEFNAGIDRRNAGIALDQASQDAAMQQRDARQRIGAARAAYGASGVTEEGSPLDVLEMSAANAERDKQTILKKGQLRAMGYTDAATLDTMRGNSADRAGDYASASAVLTGASRAYGSGTRGAQSGYNPSSTAYGSYGSSLVED